MEHERIAMRAARQIREQIGARRQAQCQFYLPVRPWERSERYLNQIELARQKGFHRSAAVLCDRLLWQVNYCRQQLDHLSTLIEQQTSVKPLPSVLLIYQEIQGLGDEFGDYELDLKAGELSVVTEPIVLEEIELGRFQILLDWKHLSYSPCYRVVALDPHPANDSSYVHPHVQNQQLCEGEGRQAIESALEDGRLSDFFLIVARLLATYGKGNAYIELSQWRSIDCEQCGGATYEDDRYCCTGCGDTLCDSCTYTCQDCSESYCGSCISSCASCDQELCAHCLSSCCQCQGSVCAQCRKPGQCQTCQHAPNSPGDDDDEGGATDESIERSSAAA